MKHAGSRDNLLRGVGSDPLQSLSALAEPQAGKGQSRLSIVLCIGCMLFLVAVVADAPVRTLAGSLDPTVIAALRIATEFGNSAWSLGIGLALLAILAVAKRAGLESVAADLKALKSVLLLLVGSVAISGVTASLAKNLIGRLRPSTLPDASVFEFSVMAFRAGWASFPSGHATTAAACALTLAICAPRHSWAWVSIGLVAALSRAFLGVHWLSDCLAGLLLGTVVTLVLRKRMAGQGHQFVLNPAMQVPALAAVAAQLGKEAWSLGVTLFKGVLRLLRRAAAWRPRV